MLKNKVSKHVRKLCCLSLLLMLCLIMVACGAGKSSTESSSDPKQQEAAATFTPSHKLVYGININAAEGWFIKGFAERGTSTNEEINELLNKGNKIRIITLYRTIDNTPQGQPNAEANFILVNTEGYFLPEDQARKKSASDFNTLSAELFERDRQEALSKNAVHSVQDFKMERKFIDGQLAIIKNVKFKTSDNEGIRYTAEVYLPNQKGLIIACDALSSLPNASQIIDDFVSKNISFNNN